MKCVVEIYQETGKITIVRTIPDGAETTVAGLLATALTKQADHLLKAALKEARSPAPIMGDLRSTIGG